MTFGEIDLQLLLPFVSTRFFLDVTAKTFRTRFELKVENFQIQIRAEFELRTSNASQNASIDNPRTIDLSADSILFYVRHVDA